MATVRPVASQPDWEAAKADGTYRGISRVGFSPKKFDG